MFEKVNPSHPDKLADRIAGALVDMAYEKERNPRIAVEVLLGHGECDIFTESSANLDEHAICDAVHRITATDANTMTVRHTDVPQDAHLAGNQDGSIRCGDNGIFKGIPVTAEQDALSETMRELYRVYPFDGKAIVSDGRLVLCQSNADMDELAELVRSRYETAVINPLGYWTGGPDVDSGATNRKLGSDMADSITGGGLHGKDLSKADVSVNVYAWLKAQETGEAVELCCAIGDEKIDGKPYSEVVATARDYIMGLGGFERFAEWGLV